MRFKHLSVLGFLFIFCGQALAAHGPIDGNWLTREVTCGGEPANTSTRAAYEPPNYILMTISQHTGSFVEMRDGCETTTPFDISYNGNVATVHLNQPIQCYPANCTSSCGFIYNADVNYTFEIIKKKKWLRWTSEVTTLDPLCTSNMQLNPVEYLLENIR